MNKQKIERINELAAKAKAQELSESEKSEQKALRDEYIAAYRQSLESQLKDITILNEDGTKSKIKKREEQFK